jgi:quinol monooxygenase YgiN/catechol 2,3-dioxygenase-like lactoylglutathione lyase family enzyme
VIIVTGSVVVRPDAVDEALAVSLEHVYRSRTEPGCLLHSVHRDAEDPNRLVFLERWRDRKALDAHFRVPASGEFVERLSELAVHTPTMEVFDTSPPRSPALLHQVARHHWDLDDADRFYGEVLGLRRIARFDPPGLLFFELGDTRLLVEPGDPEQNSVLYLWVDDLDVAWAELAELGAEAVAEPHLIHADADGQFGPPGEEEWMAFFKDHDGGILALVTRRPGDG